MPTLSIVRTDFGKILKWGGIIISIIIILLIALKLLFLIKQMIFPSAPPPPTVTFGKLPKPYFPEGIKKDYTYEIDTLTGDLPNFKPAEKVYKMEQRGPDILAVERISQAVSYMGFNSRPQQISDFVYKWSSPKPPEQNIIMNIKLSEFNLSSSISKHEQYIKSGKFQNKSRPIVVATNFLNGLDFNTEEIDEEKTKVEFGILKDGVISPTTRMVISDIATVYFFQKNKDDLPIVYPQGPNSSMRMLVGAGDDGKVLEGQFSYQKVLDESATYPIKTSQEAFEDLKNGKAYVASFSGTNSNVKIKNIYLALYSEGRLQEYMTPVVVFEGNDNFIAYVSGIKDDWVNN